LREHAAPEGGAGLRAMFLMSDAGFIHFHPIRTQAFAENAKVWPGSIVHPAAAQLASRATHNPDPTPAVFEVLM